MIFGGSAWELKGLKEDYSYFDRLLYSKFDVHSHCERIIGRIESLTERDLFDMADAIPETWFARGDYDAFASLCTSLECRKDHLYQLVSKQLDSRSPNCSKRSSAPISHSDSLACQPLAISTRPNRVGLGCIRLCIASRADDSAA